MHSLFLAFFHVPFIFILFSYYVDLGIFLGDKFDSFN